MATSARSETLSVVAASAACILVAAGCSRGLWWSNIHNGILGVTLSLVGAWLVAARPRSREGTLFLLAGLGRGGHVPRPAGRPHGHRNHRLLAGLAWRVADRRRSADDDLVSLVPLIAGWSALHGSALARYTALSWLTDAHQGQVGLATALARTAAHALDAPAATVWMGDEAGLHVVGAWPDTDLTPAASPLQGLPDRAWPVRSGSEVVGAIVVPGVTVLTRGEEQMMQDLGAQAALLRDRLTLAELVQQEWTAGHLTRLTRREHEVLELMARGLTNAAICQELHLSVKTVEPLISTVFTKLGLHADPTVNRRVLAALEYHRR